MNYAVVQNGAVVNMVVWDGEAEWSPPEGAVAVPVPEGSGVSIDWAYADGEFTAPPPPPVIPPTAAETLASNTATRNVLLAAATLAIAPLQDAVDFGEATAAESALLNAWKQFRIAVNRVDITKADTVWPTPPQTGYGAAVTDPVQSA